MLSEIEINPEKKIKVTLTEQEPPWYSSLKLIAGNSTITDASIPPDSVDMIKAKMQTKEVATFLKALEDLELKKFCLHLKDQMCPATEGQKKPR